ncbi:hypothetical protein BH11PLA1_BH11PLA1_03290 [soil metagenome]
MSKALEPVLTIEISGPAAGVPTPAGGSPLAASVNVIGVPPAASLLRAFMVLERLQATNDLHEVLELIINALRETLGADRASVFQFDDQSSELFISQAHGGVEIRFPITKGIAGEAARSRKILNIPDCYADARFNPEVDRQTGYRTRNMLTIPLMSGDALEGVAQVLNKHETHGTHFDPHDETVARLLAAQAAIALRRAKLLHAEARKNKIEHDLAIARKIQQAGFPAQLPSIAGYDLAAFSSPAEETGGDAYDLFQPGVSDTPGAEGSDIAPLLFALGDATGHGIGPALSAGQFRAMFRMGGRLDADLPMIARQINAQLCQDLPGGRFVTAFMGNLDPVANTIEYVAAGQAPIILARADGTADVRDATALPLGLDVELAIDDAAPFCLEPGDVFLLISDGIYEAQNRANKHFGQDGLLKAVAAAGRQATATEVINTIVAHATKFAEGRPFDDDQTGIVIKRM